MEKDHIQTQAAAYAKATTHSRCARMDQCQNCSVRYCDYRSRCEAYMQGYKAAQPQGTYQPMAEYQPSKHIAP